ncbi:MAG: acyltransferase [bacterium]|nr:acyltransferase [bacterium]
MTERLGVLDGLRCYATLIVLWYHLAQMEQAPAPAPVWLPYIPIIGYVGLFSFFFISGFLIAYPFIQARVARRPEPAWGHFAWRRFIKVVPSYALSIVIAYAIGYAAIVRNGSTVPQEIVTHALFIHTWWPQTYFSINWVLWTLAIEVQFYVVFPALWWCFRRQPWVTGLAMIALAWVVRSLAPSCCGGTLTQVARNLPGYTDYFACGMLCAWLFVRFGHRLREGRNRYLMFAFAVSAFAVLGLWMFAKSSGVPVAIQIGGTSVFQIWSFAGIAFGIITLGALCSPRGWSFILANPVTRFVAIISLNLYLYHQMIARELRLRFPSPAPSDAAALGHWQVTFFVAAVVLAIGVAVLLTYAMERPLLRLSPKTS